MGCFGPVKTQQDKRAQRLAFWVQRPPGVVSREGVVAKKFVPSLESLSSLILKRGIWDVTGILLGCPGPLGLFTKFVQKKFVRIFRSLMSYNFRNQKADKKENEEFKTVSWNKVFYRFGLWGLFLYFTVFGRIVLRNALDSLVVMGVYVVFLVVYVFFSEQVDSRKPDDAAGEATSAVSGSTAAQQGACRSAFCNMIITNQLLWRHPAELPRPPSVLKLGCTPRGSCNRALLRTVLRRFSNSKCFWEGFLEGCFKGFQ